MSWQVFAVSLGAFLILMWLLEHNKANQTSTLFFLVNPVSALMAFIILNERFTYEKIKSQGSKDGLAGHTYKNTLW